jgi:hypothetical protein
MTTEEYLKLYIGTLVFQQSILASQLDDLKARQSESQKEDKVK